MSKNDILLDIRNLKIEGFSDEKWHPIVKGVDLTLRRGQIMGLIGESGAGKSTLGLAAMGYTQPGCRITGGEITFDGVDLTTLSEKEKREYWGNRITYVAQSAAASFNPAHRLINQTTASTIRFGIKPEAEAKADAVTCNSVCLGLGFWFDAKAYSGCCCLINKAMRGIERGRSRLCNIRDAIAPIFALFLFT